MVHPALVGGIVAGAAIAAILVYAYYEDNFANRSQPYATIPNTASADDIDLDDRYTDTDSDDDDNLDRFAKRFGLRRRRRRQGTTPRNVTNFQGRDFYQHNSLPNTSDASYNTPSLRDALSPSYHVPTSPALGLGAQEDARRSETLEVSSHEPEPESDRYELNRDLSPFEDPQFELHDEPHATDEENGININDSEDGSWLLDNTKEATVYDSTGQTDDDWTVPVSESLSGSVVAISDSDATDQTDNTVPAQNLRVATSNVNLLPSGPKSDDSWSEVDEEMQF